MQKTVKKAQKGFTLIELLIVIAVIAILAAIAIPNLLSSRKAANESSAISSLRTIVTAQETYRSRFSTYGTLANLESYKFIDSKLADGKKSGYDFALTAKSPADSGYSVIAKASSQGGTGDRSFFVDETGVIRADAGAAAALTSSPID